MNVAAVKTYALCTVYKAYLRYTCVQIVMNPDHFHDCFTDCLFLLSVNLANSFSMQRMITRKDGVVVPVLVQLHNLVKQASHFQTYIWDQESFRLADVFVSVSFFLSNGS